MAESSGFEGRVAVITGGTGDLGRVVARRFAAGGARLALLGRRTGLLEELAGELSLSEDRYLVASADLTDAAEARRAAASVIDKFGRVEMLLHLVGGFTAGKSVVDVPAEQLSSMLDQHVWTTFHAAQAFVPHMVENGWGRLVTVSYRWGLRPPGKLAPYAIGKAGQEVLMRSLAQELVGTGVTSNSVLVGSIGARSEKRGAKTTPPEEIASTIAYLCSDEARMINGARIPAYGRP